MKRFVLLAIVSLSGCAGAGGVDCAADWFEIGKRDGRIGAYSQADRYAARCGAALDRERYEQGHRAGSAERPRPPV
jgi:hypothetical protein